MYVVTFYSFKGGTGRTMALVNVGVELAKRGRRVLMVDFDLEAPGLDTFGLACSASNVPGLVDFVCYYDDHQAVPDVRAYLYRATVDSLLSGEMWVMSAGRQDAGYDERFRSIDWQELYEKRDGFLLFEDLKAQWAQTISPDYVLIDSRTGHTDIGGICTRQLPDAVVVTFFPNEQNRRGLIPIVDQIRQEASGPLSKEINLHFVMANVPDLDDEEEILAGNAQKLRKSLSFHELDAVIHHYDSLALLDQTVFALQRPKSSLSREYRELTNAIVRRNLEDEDGAIEFLEDAFGRVRSRDLTFASALEQKLSLIRAKHSQHLEVLRRLIRLRQRQRKSEETLTLLNQALTIQDSDPELLIARAELYSRSHIHDKAIDDLRRILQMNDVSPFDLAVAIRLLRKLTPNFVTVIQEATALQRADADPELVRELQSAPETLPLAESILRHWLLSNPGDVGMRNELVLCLIGMGKFLDAKLTIARNLSDLGPEKLDNFDAFNYAMAEWGDSGTPDQSFLAQVVSLHEKGSKYSGSNYMQCMALAYWGVGNRYKAVECLRSSVSTALTSGDWSFSAWSYLQVPPETIADEAREMDFLFSGADQKPRFITRNENSMRN